MYLYSKKPHLGHFFTVKDSRYGGKFAIHLMTSGNFDSEKVDQDGIFYYKDILHFFFE
jgi:hypothetical protein